MIIAENRFAAARSIRKLGKKSIAFVVAGEQDETVLFSSYSSSKYTGLKVLD